MLLRYLTDPELQGARGCDPLKFIRPMDSRELAGQIAMYEEIRADAESRGEPLSDGDWNPYYLIVAEQYRRTQKAAPAKKRRRKRK